MVGVLSPELEEVLVSTAGRLATAASVGQAMREVRDRLGMTQADLADLLEIRRETLSRIEAGHTSPALAVVDRLARIVTMSRAVRDHLALLDRNAATPNYLYFRMIGVSLRLPPALVDRVVQVAYEGFDRKRDQILRSVGV